MKNSPQPTDPLEVFVTRALREVSAHPAPAALEARVLREIARLAALPWWRKSFAYWPKGIRQIFFLLSAVAAGLVVAGLFAVTMRLPEVSVASGLLERFEWLSAARDIFASVGRGVGEYLRDLPAVYIYGVVAGIATAFAFLLGTGAAAYRYFRMSR